MFVFCVYTCYFFILIKSGRVILEDCNVCEEITNLGVPETPGCMNCVFFECDCECTCKNSNVCV